VSALTRLFGLPVVSPAEAAAAKQARDEAMGH
jgi:hypothetical protein